MRARLRNGVLASLALHVLIVLTLSRLAWPTSEPDAALSRPPTFAWLMTLSPAVPAPSAAAPTPFETPRRSTETKSRPRAPIGPAPEHRAAETQNSGASSQDTPTRAPSLDPTEARRHAIEGVLEEREHTSSYRSFAFPGTIGEQQAFDDDAAHRREEAGLQPPLTAFDSPSKGRAGLEEASVPGEHFRWISDNCYQPVGMGNPFTFVPMMTPTLCARAHPRDDLFVSAKPTYLMSATERQATARHVQRIERLRRPTTGAVMPLETGNHAPQASADRPAEPGGSAGAQALRDVP